MAQFRKDIHQFLADGKTIFEVMMLADQYGNIVGSANPTGMAVDAFGRARVSQPVTLFDSFHRYGDNGKITTANTNGGTFAWNANTASIDCTVNSTSSAAVYRESARTFAYQPGKSLQVLTTFIMNPAKDGLRQRIGYFGANNGFFLQRSGAANTATEVAFVKRSTVTGATVDTPVYQSNWNIDKMDGTGPSQMTLNLDDPQILFTDIEWLGVGSVRMGFVINGQYIHCHTFHHANIDTAAKGAYMQTACLPVRMEIENTGGMTGTATYKQVCTTVISEGGYELRGRSRTLQTPLANSSHRALATAGTFYPIISIRLKPDRLDGIAAVKDINLVGINSANYQYKLVYNATIAGATWANAETDSTGLVEYQTNSTATMSGGTDLISGLFTSTNQSTALLTLDPGVFSYQLERNSFTSTPFSLTLAVASSINTSNVIATMNYQEIT